MADFQTLLYEHPAPHVARIVLNRPETRNAQDTRLLYELNDAFDSAARDNEVKVIILAASGPHFSGNSASDTYAVMKDYRTVGTWCGLNVRVPKPRCTRERNLHRLGALAEHLKPPRR
jgi:enoyl-CoA hydratase